jgi:hypothetical protein
MKLGNEQAIRLGRGKYKHHGTWHKQPDNNNFYYKDECNAFQNKQNFAHVLFFPSYENF